jgi:2-polyprenyl-3-methyl-5-hydroxy-6-metoxy-1,4-benzoquinol methylase
MTGTKQPYLREITRAAAPGAHLLDYGCGIGSDGLALIEAGYRVSFADFENPSVEYLRWRIRRRGLTAPIYDLDAGDPPGGFDVAYALDVAEHVPDPFDFLTRLERCARLVAVNLLDPEEGETALHHELPTHELVHLAARRGLRRYRRYYGRSHMVIYGDAGSLHSKRALMLGRLASLVTARRPPP